MFNYSTLCDVCHTFVETFNIDCNFLDNNDFWMNRDPQISNNPYPSNHEYLKLYNQSEVSMSIGILWKIVYDMLISWTFW